MNKFTLLFLISILSLLSSCKNQPIKAENNQVHSANESESFLIVDCLLPGQLRKLGQGATYLTPRRPIKTSASDCEIRGGEYVAYDRSNYSTALKIWLPRAKEGDAEAQAYVGEIYEKGLGLEPDYSVAIQWYRKAAEQGNTRAQLNLGYLYETGKGVKADKNLAMEWYRKASGLADKNIAYTYTAGINVQEQSNEIRALQAELTSSRKQSQKLKGQLENTQQKMLLNEKKLLLSQDELNKIKSQKNINADNKNITLLINKKEAEINEQKKINQQLQQQYKSQIGNLELKLSETEKRAEQLRDDLQRNRNEKNLKQMQLLETQAQIAKNEKELLKLKAELQKEKLGVENVELTQAQKLQYQIELSKLQLQDAQKQLDLSKREKNQKEKIIQNLTAENKRYNKKIEDLNKQLASSKSTHGEINHLKNALSKQILAAGGAQQKLKESEKQYQKFYNEYKIQESSYNIKLAKLESEKKHFEALYADTFQQSRTEQQKFEQLLAKKKQQWNEQQQQISNLIEEKQQLIQELEELKVAVSKEKPSEGPVIEIIDPSFAQVRGLPMVTLRSVVKNRQITGKVKSSLGLLSLTVNDIDSSVDQYGLFKEDIPLLQHETPVNVTAIDTQGKKASLDFIISMKETIRLARSNKKSLPQSTESKEWKSIDFGKYYAIIIANNKYNKIPSLETPINDAKKIEKLLKHKYGFITRTLYNATRYEILSLLNEYRTKLTENDNLLVYYAGHGELDRVNMRGHWLPVDADADNTANWISTVALTDIFNAMSSKHLMVVADSCYSGAMTRASLARLDSGKTEKEKIKWLKAMLKARSRTILSSGGLKPVLDGGGGDHSVFAMAFIDSLENNNSLLEGQEIYRKISKRIVAIAADYGVEQVPEYSPMRHAGHEAGEFFFVPN